MKRRCGGANMGGNKWLSTVGDENGAEGVAVVGSWKWCATDCGWHNQR